MIRHSLYLSLTAASLIGCQSAIESVTAPAPTAASSSPASKSDAAPTQVSANEPAAAPATPAPEQKNKSVDQTAKNFAPPFPNRADLFEPPHSSAGVARREEEHGATVELKGFVNVNGQQVVLAIDGVVSPIPEGGQKYGVQVISINPPSVVLQRGRSRWTASLD